MSIRPIHRILFWFLVAKLIAIEIVASIVFYHWLWQSLVFELVKRSSSVRFDSAKILIYFVSLAFLFSPATDCQAADPVPDKTVVLTLDDAESQIEFVAPLLQQMGFKATFFISQAWMDDKVHFLSWEDVADLYRRGFEIGNHTWTHAVFDQADKAVTLGQGARYAG